MIEYALYKFRRFREVDESRDRNFSAFRRYDAPNYSRLKLYPGAMLWMPTRLILLALDGILLCIIVHICSIGHDYSQGPM